MNIDSDMNSAQFENVNALRAFPFAGDCAPADRTGRRLPDDLIVDLHMVVPALPRQDSGSSGSGEAGVMPAPHVRMSSLHVSPFMVSACFVSACEGCSGAVSVTVSRENFRPYMPYRLVRLAGSFDMGGIVTFGDFSFPGSAETYFFDDAEIHQCCVSAYEPPRLRSFVDARSGARLSGDVEIGFSGFVSASRDGQSVRLSLEDGATEELASECYKASGSDLCGATPISSINGVRPDSEGNIVLWFH